MQLLIENILSHGEKSVEFNVGPTLVTGKNSSGKTNILAIIAALTAHNANPKSLAATNSKMYVKDGATEGSASLGDGDTAIEWSPTSGLSIPPGVEPSAAEQAVGLTNFITGTRDKKLRAAKFQSLFLPEDPMAILKPGWNQSQEQLDYVVAEITDQGWDAADAVFISKRKQAKASWQSCTGHNYGATAATAWTPDGWRTELTQESEDSLRDKLSNAQDVLRAATTAVGISESVIAEARRVRDDELPSIKLKVEDLASNLDDSKQALHRLRADREERAQEFNRLNGVIEQHKAVLGAKAPFECPHCNKGIKISGMDAVAWYKPSDKEQAAAHREKIDAELAQKEIKKSIVGVDETGKAESANRDSLAEQLQQAKIELATTQDRARDADKEPAESLSYAEQAKLEEDVNQARQDMHVWKLNKTAQRHHENVVEYDAICAYLGPNGARAALMKKEMGALKKFMKDSSKHSGWGDIRLSENFEMSYDGRSVQLCAENEQRKCQWLMQATCAIISKSEWLLLDAVDLLRDESWNGLVSLMNWISNTHPDMHIVVAGTTTETPKGWQAITLD